MLYVIYAEDHPNTREQRRRARPTHLARIDALQEEGRVVVGGPCPAIDTEDPAAAGFTGSVLIVEFASLEAATTWANADPYIAAGVYAKVTVKPFLQVYPR